MRNFLSSLLAKFKKASPEEDEAPHETSRLADGTVSDDWLVPIWEGEFVATFTYYSAESGRLRRTVTVTTVRQNMRGELYFRGFCQLRNEERTFKVGNIKTKLTVDGKKYDVPVYLESICGIDVAAVHPDVQARRDEGKSKVRSRLKTVWTGEENIYFRYDEEGDFPSKIDIILTEVAVSKTGIIFLIMETPDRLYVFDTRRLASDIFYNDAYIGLYAFLMQVLHISDKSCGLKGLWAGSKDVHITYALDFEEAKKQPTTLEAVVRNRENTVLLVLKGGADEYYKFIPACNVSSVYEGDKRYGPKDFLEKRLGLHGVFARS